MLSTGKTTTPPGVGMNDLADFICGVVSCVLIQDPSRHDRQRTLN